MIDVIMDKPSQSGEELKYLVNQLPGSGWVNWTGRRAVEMLREGPVLNAHSRTNKLAQMTRLELSQVLVVPWTESTWRGEGKWLPRKADHQQGYDLTTKKSFKPDFWTKFIPFDDEWRIHGFRQRNGKIAILRSGLKLPKEAKFHPWVKSNRLGWKISYLGGAPDSARSLARQALDALMLDFGAVDIGVAFDGTPYVLEVNTCPGIEGNTLEMYAENIGKRLK